MFRAVMMSIRPQHAVDILNRNKTLELRKRVPKWFNGWIYIYVTKAKPYIRELGDNYFTECSEVDVYKLNGKVVARFWFDETYYITQAINVYGDKLNQISIYDNNTYGWKTPKEQQKILKQLCLTEQQVLDYGKGKDLYALHIKRLEIFDEPMELNDFYGILKGKNTIAVPTDRLMKAPQSLQYVYVRGNENEI